MQTTTNLQGDGVPKAALVAALTADKPSKTLESIITNAQAA